MHAKKKAPTLFFFEFKLGVFDPYRNNLIEMKFIKVVSKRGLKL